MKDGYDRQFERDFYACTGSGIERIERSRNCVTPPTRHTVSSEGVIFFFLFTINL